MELIPNCPEISLFLSTSITTSLKPYFDEASSNKGDNLTHGPHHVAKKSTITGFVLLASTTSLSNELFVEK